ncbi:hypothetical protein JYK22_18210, partial [Nonomuraea sp. RK-328]|nr:hypothetical protein [Nonomuraea sp. RK-328]
MPRPIHIHRKKDPTKTTRQDVADALATVASFQNFVQHADTKAIALIAAHAGSITVMASQSAGAGALLGRSTPATLAGSLVLGLFALGLVMSSCHLMMAIRPTSSAPARPSRFAITGVRAVTPRPGDLRHQFHEAWALARLLGQIAETKHRHVRRAIPWTALTLAAMIIWCAGVLIAR